MTTPIDRRLTDLDGDLAQATSALKDAETAVLAAPEAPGTPHWRSNTSS